MELIADKLEPLIVAGYTYIRSTRRQAATSPPLGGSQTVKIVRPRQIAELTNSMNNRTDEATPPIYFPRPTALGYVRAPAKVVTTQLR